MTLNDYLDKGIKTPQEIAKLTGLTEASISRIRKGQQNLSRDTMLAIQKATNGKVKPNDLALVA